jgi:hypothetical protein
MDGIPLFRCLLFSVLSVLSRKLSSRRVTGGGYIFFYHRGCLVPGVKNFGFWGVTSDVSWDVRRGVRILIKKLIT